MPSDMSEEAKKKRAAEREARSKARGEARTKKAASPRAARAAKASAAKKMSVGVPKAPAQAYSTKDALPTSQEKAPKDGDKYSRAAKRSEAKRASARMATEAKASPSASAKSKSPKNYGGVVKAVGRAVPYVGAVAAGVAAGYEVGKALTGKSGVDAGGGQMKRGQEPTMADQARNMARQSYEKDKGRNKAAIESRIKPTTSASDGAKSVTKPVASSNYASAPKAVSERPSAKPKGGKAHSEIMKDGKSKQMKRNAGYDNYKDIMSSHGLAEGGRVPGGYELDVSPMGMVRNAARAVRDIKKGMQKNAPKAASSNQKPVERKSPRKDGNSGRQLVPESVMDDVRASRGYADGGQVGHKDVYGSYGGSGGVAKHVVKVEKTNLKRNG